MDCYNLTALRHTALFLSHSALHFHFLLSISSLFHIVCQTGSFSPPFVFSCVCVFPWLSVVSQRALGNAKAGRRTVTLWMHRRGKRTCERGRIKRGNKGIPWNVTVFDAFWALTYIYNDTHPRVCTLYIILQRGLCMLHCTMCCIDQSQLILFQGPD